jgi:hypothetical protein
MLASPSNVQRIEQNPVRSGAKPAQMDQPGKESPGGKKKQPFGLWVPKGGSFDQFRMGLESCKRGWR